MKNIILTTLTIMCLALSVSAQDFQGKAIYETKVTKAPDFRGRDMTEARRKEITERMKSAMEKTHILTFNRTTSYYVEDEKLEAPGSGGSRWMRFMGGDAGKLYKDIKNQNYVKQVEMYSKVFLIKDELKRPEWKMGAETKKIGNYTCYKATLTTPIDTTGAGAMAKMFRRGRNNNASTQRKIPTEKIVTAWYTLDIPISQGPGEYWGLPGLILEVEAEKSTLVCTKIVMNATDKIVVKAPEKGKKINQKDFDKLKLKKRKEMMENFRRRGRGNGSFH